MTKFASNEIPTSAYRLQLNSDLSLEKATALIPYLKNLGIEAVYCSPFYEAYSEHGYDVTNPNCINPIIGNEKGFESFLRQLKKHGIQIIVDVVPNHMGMKGGRNKWWQDVLENGPNSEYAHFFDIDWSSEKLELANKVLLPILGDSYGAVLEDQRIKLSFDDGAFILHYADYPLPVAPHTYAIILEEGSSELKKRLGENHADWKEYQELINLYSFFPDLSCDRDAKNKNGRKRLLALVKRSLKVRQFLKSRITLFNGKKKAANSFDYLDRLLENQFYRLSFWRVACHEINYRRFFNIHELVAIRIEDEDVLEAHHRWLFELIGSGKVQGLRIDHPDGLYDPVCYFATIRNRYPLFTVVEKILDRKEHLPSTWQVEGTVGYEYLNLLNGLFIRQDKEKDFTEIYEDFIEASVDFEEVVYESKKLFAIYHMASEVEALGLRLDHLSENSRHYRDFTRHDLTKALQEVIACFPVYRTYIGPEGGVSKRDARYINIAIQKAKSRARQLDVSIFDFLEKLLLLKLKIKKEELEGYREFILRFQQLTGPIMAKGLEDTTFYIYNRFISLNEVGGDPQHFGYSTSDFHRFNLEKRTKWPYGFLSSSTHDTKRSEDVRMRLNVISEISEKWRLEVKKWAMVNSKHKIDGIPSANTEYFIYQTLVGIWQKSPFKKGELLTFTERIWQVILKSMREARGETSWISPDHHYEDMVKTFLYAILSPDKNNHFLNLFLPFCKIIDRLGSWNSISATALKNGSCGVVDIYQGNEMLNYRLVDPDNRTPVDFDIRKKGLSSLKNSKPQKLFCASDLGKMKLFIHAKTLHFRKENKALVLGGEYIPLKLRGHRKENVVAYIRRICDKNLIVLAGRFFATLIHNEWELPIGRFVWGDTEVLLPSDLVGREFLDIFTEKKIKVKPRGHYNVLSIAEVFESMPVSYLHG